jgi:hypothetical protein
MSNKELTYEGLSEEAKKLVHGAARSCGSLLNYINLLTNLRNEIEPWGVSSRHNRDVDGIVGYIPGGSDTLIVKAQVAMQTAYKVLSEAVQFLSDARAPEIMKALEAGKKS